MSALEICSDKDTRRRDIRAHLGAGGTPDLNGLDYLEVEDDQLHLRVYFLGKAPKNIEVGNFLIEGGIRIKNIKVVGLRKCATDDPFLDDCITLEVDKYGDFSTYTLRLVEADEYGRPTDRPLLTGFDQRYSSLDFSFKVNCPSDLDCKTAADCPPDVLEQPDISYLAKDYASFRQLILDRLSLLMPDWKERHAPDLNIALIEILAYVGDHLSYYQDAVATEAYLDTARQRISVSRHVRLVDYRLHEGNNSRAWLFLETSIPRVLNPANFYFITGQKLPLGTTSRVISEDDLRDIPGDDYEVFEAYPTTPFGVYPDHNAMTIYTWGDRECCLPRGTTSATLQGQLVEHTDDAPPPPALPAPRKAARSAAQTKGDGEYDEGNDGDEGEETPYVPQIHLKAGDFVLFEEVKGAKSGAAADTDLSHRHVVRLTKVEAGYDTLYERAVVEIEWAEEDALPFALCLSGIAPLSEPPCQYVEGISVARANLILVDNGRQVVEDLEPVPGQMSEPVCECQDELSDTTTTTGRFRPWLKKGPLTYRQPLPTDTPTRSYPASGLLNQHPRYALPVINLSDTDELPGAVNVVDKKMDAQTIKEHQAGIKELKAEAEKWQPVADLLASGRLDHHYVVEIDDFGRAHLRFGDDELGYAPAPGTTLTATYRVGNGPSGNVGAETISHLVQRNVEPLPGTLTPRNPMAAVGGALPQPVAEAKLLAPQAFKATLERAVIPADYARLTQENFPTKIQRATANLRWTGSWYEMQVAIDPFGRERAEQSLLDEVLGRLYRYRRIGHDLVIKPARYVPLDVALQICVKPDYLRGHVKAVLQNVLSNRRLPDGSLGFFHPDRLSFGENIYLSKLVAAVGAVEGVESVDVLKLQRLNESADGELENGLLPLGPLEVAQLDNDPNFPEHGRLILDMRGGR